MSNFITKIKQFISLAENDEKREFYVIKFRKVPTNIYSFNGDTFWEETTSNGVQQTILDYVSEFDDILVKKMVIKPAHSVSYIKFRTNVKGYNYMFNFFTRPDVEPHLELISQYKV